MKRLTAVIVLAFAMMALYSQATLSFCTYVDNEGYCAFNNNKFITTPDSSTGRIFMKIYSQVPMGTRLTYKIFALDKAGAETLNKVLDQQIKEEWLMVWQPYNFATDTKYIVKVFNETDKLLCSKTFELVSGKQ